MVTALAEQQGEVPADIVAFIDGLDPDGVEAMASCSVVGLRLTHGSVEMEDGPLELLDEQLAAAADDFVHNIENLVIITPETGLPTAAFNAEGSVDSYKSPLDDSSATLSSWLESAHRHLPEAADEALEKMVDAASQYEPEQFDLALEIAKKQSKSKGEKAAKIVHRDARHLARAIIHKLEFYSTNLDLLRHGAALPLVKRFGRAEDLIGLKQRIFELERQQDPEYQSTDYDEFAAEASALFLQHQHGVYGTTELTWLIQQDPRLTAELVTQNPAQAARLRRLGTSALLRLTETDRTPAHTTALEQLEQQTAGDLAEYADFLREQFERLGALSEQQLITLADLVLAAPDTRPTDWACKLLCALAPIEQITRILHERPRLLQYEPDIGAMSVRRLVRAGLLDEAKAIAEQPLTNDTIDGFFNPVYNFLAIYEETGDETAWEEAEQRIAKIRSGKHYTYPTHWYKVTVRQFAAARRQGNIERAEAAATKLEDFYSNKRDDVRGMALANTVQLFLDWGELDKAELMAVRLYQHQVNQARYRGGWERFDGLLAVVDAYVAAGQPEMAADTIRRYILSDPRPDYHVSMALEALKGDAKRYGKRMITRHLDPITEFLS